MQYSIDSSNFPDLDKSVIVFDNLINENKADFIEKYILDRVTWQFNSYTTSIGKDKKFEDLNNINDQFQFVCPLLNNVDAPNAKKINFVNTQENESLILLYPLLEVCFKQKIELYENSILRIKANLQTRKEDKKGNQFSIPHIDCMLPSKNYTLIYYVNDSDGDTFFFNEEVNSLSNMHDVSELDKLTVYRRVTPKKGRAVLFRSDILHAGSHPKKSEKRIIINYNFFPYPSNIKFIQ